MCEADRNFFRRAVHGSSFESPWMQKLRFVLYEFSIVNPGLLSFVQIGLLGTTDFVELEFVPIYFY